MADVSGLDDQNNELILTEGRSSRARVREVYT